MDGRPISPGGMPPGVDTLHAAVGRLRGMLSSHQPADAAEAADLGAMQRFLAAAAQPFSRQQQDAHFTASAIVLAPDDSGVALLHHRKLDRILQPGGHFEAGDDGNPLAAAAREAGEELGVATVPVTQGLLDVDAHEIPARGDVASHHHLDLRFLLRSATFQLAADAQETAGARWYGWHELDDVALDPALRRALGKAAALLGQDVAGHPQADGSGEKHRVVRRGPSSALA